MDVSPLTEHDLPDLARLYQQLIPNDISLTKMQAALQRNQRDPHYFLPVVRRDRQVVGSLLAVVCDMLFGQCRSFMVIEDVIVDRTQRRSGIGAALMRSAEDYALTRNCSYIMLITDTERIESQQFYRSLGYKTDEYRAFKKGL